MNKPTKPFPFAVCRYPQADKLNPLDKLIAAYLSWRQGAHAWAWPSLARIASDLGLEKRVVLRSIRRLVASNLLLKESGRAGRGHVSRYSVAAPGIGDRESPFQTARKGDIQYTEKGTSRRVKGDCGSPEQQVTTKNNNNARARGGYTPDFETVWDSYPKRVGKAEAWAAWEELDPGQDLVAQILASIRAHLQSEQWARSLAEDGGRYIPKLATFLRRRQWEDEPPAPPSSDGCTDMDPDAAAELIARAFAIEGGEK